MDRIEDLVANLSAAEAKNILKLVEELDRRDREGGAFEKFEPTSKQHGIISSKKRVRVVMGGNRTGKSEISAFETACHATGLYPAWWTGVKYTEAIDMGIVSPDTGQMLKTSQRKLMGPPDSFGTGFIPKELILELHERPQTNGCLDFALIKHASGGTTRMYFMTTQQTLKSFMGFMWRWCVAEGEPVLMADGNYKPIETIVPGDLVMSMTYKGEPVARKVTATAYIGEKEVVRVSPKYGPSFVVTPDHNIYTSLTVKREAQEANKVVQMPYAFSYSPKECRDDVWYMAAGLVCSEGSTSCKKITMGDCEAVRSLITAMPEGAWVRKKEMSNHNHVPDWFINWPEFWADFPVGKSHEKVVPDWVIQSPAEKVTVFLGYLYAGDGWFSGHTVGYATTSVVMANQVSSILWRLGIRSIVTFRKSKKEKWRDQYWVMVTRAEDVVRFGEVIPAIKNMDKTMSEAQRRLDSRTRMTEALSERQSHLWDGHIAKRPGRKRPPSKFLEGPIKDIKPAGVARVYDISVEDEHRFFLGTSLVSNCWFDEEPPWEYFDETRFRMLDKGGNIMLSFYPPEGQTELISFLEEMEKKNPEYYETWFLEWADNPTLDPETVEMMEKTTPDWLKESRKYGRTGAGEGRCFPYSRDIYVCDPFEIERHWRQIAGFDVGFGHYTGAVCVAFDDMSDTAYVYKEYFSKEQLPSIHASALRRWGDVEFCIDTSSKRRSPTDGKNLFKMYSDEGLRLRDAETRGGSVESSIAMINTLLSERRLFVFSSCPNLIKQMGGYRRVQDKQGKWSVLAKDNDLCLGGENKVLTLEYGWRRIDSLVGQEFTIMTPLGWQKAHNVHKTGIKNTMRSTLSSGASFTHTPDHKFLAEERGFSFALLDPVRYYVSREVAHGTTPDFTGLSGVQWHSFLLRRSLLHPSPEWETSHVAPDGVGVLQRGDWRFEDARTSHRSQPAQQLNLKPAIDEFCRTPIDAHAGAGTSRSCQEEYAGSSAFSRSEVAQVGRRPGGPSGACEEDWVYRKPSNLALYLRRMWEAVRSNLLLKTAFSRERNEVLLSQLQDEGIQTQEEQPYACGGPIESNRKNLRGMRQELHDQSSGPVQTLWAEMHTESIVAQEEVGEREVYDLTVDVAHCFFLDCGIVASNCDPLRYAVMWLNEAKTPGVARLGPPIPKIVDWAPVDPRIGI